jgi:hypothetical protein
MDERNIKSLEELSRLMSSCHCSQASAKALHRESFTLLSLLLMDILHCCAKNINIVEQDILKAVM